MTYRQIFKRFWFLVKSIPSVSKAAAELKRQGYKVKVRIK